MSIRINKSLPSLSLNRFLDHLTCESSTSSATETKVQLISTETHQTHVLADVVFGQRVEISVERNKQKLKTHQIHTDHMWKREETHNMFLNNRKQLICWGGQIDFFPIYHRILWYTYCSHIHENPYLIIIRLYHGTTTV